MHDGFRKRPLNMSKGENMTQSIHQARPALVALLCAAMISPATVLAQSSQGPIHDGCVPSPENECVNGVSGGINTLDTLRYAIPRIIERSEDRTARPGKQARLKPIQVAASGGAGGLGAGVWSGWGVWGSWSRADFEDRSQISAFPGGPSFNSFDASLDSFMIGADKLLGRKLSLGGALIYDDAETKTAFNGGGVDTTGPTLVAYGSYLLSDTYSIDANLGYGWMDNKQRRIDPLAGSSLTSRFDASRWFLSATLNGAYPMGAWSFGWRAGYLHAQEDQDGYAESGGPSARTVGKRKVKLGQAYVGADVAYGFAGIWQVFATGAYRNDVTRDDGRSAGGLPAATVISRSGDRDEFQWSVGLRAFARNGFTGSIEYLKTTGRDRFDHDAVTLLGRFDF